MIQNIAVLSERGACRQDNQDAVLAEYKNDAGIFAVADGMGGHFCGELASHELVFKLKNWWEEIVNCICFMPFLEVVRDLERRVRKINSDVFQIYRERNQFGGTTLCLLLVCQNMYAVFNIGDSRLYCCKGKDCMQMTVDDIWENQFWLRKTIDKESIKKDYRYGRLTQALGAYNEVSISISTGQIERKYSFLLCSDGIYKCCTNKWLISQIRCIKDKKRVLIVAEKIRKKVYENGAKDNLSLIIVLVDPIKEG